MSSIRAKRLWKNVKYQPLATPGMEERNLQKSTHELSNARQGEEMPGRCCKSEIEQEEGGAAKN